MKKVLQIVVGDYIYYKDKKGETFPGRVLEIKNKTKIRINHCTGDREIWVDKSNLELQSCKP